MMTRRPLDLLVLGSGVAGLSAAVRAASTHGLRTGVLTKGSLDLATTRWAQGGVAAALSGDPEELDLHLADTLAAGAGLCDVDAVRVLVDEGPRRVEELISLGAEFDRDARGNLELAREGGHSVPRIVHAGGAATGAEIERALVTAVEQSVAEVYEHTFAVDLLVEDGRCVGVRAALADGTFEDVRAHSVLLATGGAGQLFWVTTNPRVATGDGVAMALRRGVVVADLEFFQFHPTALHHRGMPKPLLSEALRGHGALLRDVSGERFVDELLPRDVVSQAILTSMIDNDSDHVWLDATGLEQFESRFPTIHASLDSVGLDPGTDWLPVAPAAHHQCGGIVTDLDGATSMPGLWAAGETSCSGVHGANRLASNSLLEGMVFGPRAVEAVASGRDRAEPTGAMRSVLDLHSEQDRGEQDRGELGRSEVSRSEVGDGIGGHSLVVELDDSPPNRTAPPTVGDVAQGLRDRLQRVMSLRAGVVRSHDSLHDAAVELDSIAREMGPASEGAFDRNRAELENLLVIARVLVAAASERTESRGTHKRSDFPETDPAQRSRLVVQHFEP